MADNVVAVSDGDFESSVVKAPKLAMVDFWAEWCQPCKMLAPVIEELANENQGKVFVGKVNVDDNPESATKYGIRGIPTLLFFKDGQIVQQVVGVKSKMDIQKIIDENI